MVAPFGIHVERPSKGQVRTAGKALAVRQTATAGNVRWTLRASLPGSSHRWFLVGERLAVLEKLIPVGDAEDPQIGAEQFGR